MGNDNDNLVDKDDKRPVDPETRTASTTRTAAPTAASSANQIADSSPQDREAVDGFEDNDG